MFFVIISYFSCLYPNFQCSERFWSWIRIQGLKNQPKTAKKNFFTHKLIRTFEKRVIIKLSSFLNGSSSFRIKISEKNKTKNFKLSKKINLVNLKEMTWIRIRTIFSSADPGSGPASKLNRS